MRQNKFVKMFSEPPFREVFADISEYTDELLGEYLALIDGRDLSKNRKEIYDAIWGSIELNSSEMILVDSPLLQRLKHIRQLGLSDFVYPGSAYSRFYHTLGVTSLSSDMINTLNRIIKEKYQVLPNENRKIFYQLVRYAAILHDVGHMLLSHASEQFFAENKEALLFAKTTEMITVFLSKTGYSPALHELISCMIVNSAAVKELILISATYSENLQKAEPIERRIDQYIEYITGMIVGVPVDKFMLPYSKIVNGPVDSDKCDYLTRDSHVTKVPVAVDISRMIQKLRLVKVKSEDITLPSIWRDTTGEDIPCLEFAVANAAEKSLFQLCMARNTMYGSVYYHQKILTVETMFRDILKDYQTLFPARLDKFSEILKLNDDFLGSIAIQSLKEIANSESDPARKRDIIKLIGKMEALQTRTLCKRILNLSYEHLMGTETNRNIFWRKNIVASDPTQREQMLLRIKEEYMDLFHKVNQTSPENVEIFLVYQPMSAYDHAKIKVHIDLGTGQYRSYRGYAYLESKESNDKEYLLVTNQHDRDLFMLAAEKVLFEKHQITLKEESFACLKYNIEEIEERRQTLFAEGYYNGTCCQLITDRMLQNYIPSEKISKIVSLCAIYEGSKGQISEQNVMRFLKQFMGWCEQKDNVGELLLGITDMLLRATYISRTMFVETFINVMKDKELPHCALCNVGGKLDSSAHFAYFLNDTREDIGNMPVIERLEEWLADSSENESIIFFDDGAYSGKQIVSVFQEYIGIPKEQRATNESHVFELATEELKSKLLSSHIILFFICFNKANLDYIIGELRKIGFANIDVRFGYEMDSAVFEQQPQIVKDALKTIGKALVASKKRGNPNWDEKRIEDAALGYNNSRQMVFLKSSVPTYTITPFWFDGCTDKGIEWIPLFTRTIKP
jgi:hypothetical protein